MRHSAITLVSALAAGVAAEAEGWAGWDNAKHAFIFGDSYTQTGFNVSLEAPSESNPLGNPPYPGWTASNGPNWVGYLTTKHNATLLQTYNLAYGGATVDSALVEPWQPTVLSLADQVTSLFLPNYANASFWEPESTIFGIWIGVNDVGNSFWGGAEETGPLYEQIFEVLGGLVGDLYEAGARNFVFLNVPPIERSPLTVEQGEEAVGLEGEALERFNGLVEGLAAEVAGGREGASVWVYDAYKSFSEVLDDPAAYPATEGLKDTTTFCEEYQDGTPEWDTLIESCEYAVDEFFWLNNLHPTYPIHDVVAEGVAELLRGPPNVGGDANEGEGDASEGKGDASEGEGDASEGEGE